MNQPEIDTRERSTMPYVITTGVCLAVWMSLFVVVSVRTELTPSGDLVIALPDRSITNDDLGARYATYDSQLIVTNAMGGVILLVSLVVTTTLLANALVGFGVWIVRRI